MRLNEQEPPTVDTVLEHSLIMQGSGITSEAIFAAFDLLKDRRVKIKISYDGKIFPDLLMRLAVAEKSSHPIPSPRVPSHISVQAGDRLYILRGDMDMVRDERASNEALEIIDIVAKV